MLPGMSGEELLHYIRENKHYKIPVLVISAKDSLGDKVSLLKGGANDYITKPFEPEEVIVRVHVALRRTGKESSIENILSYKKKKNA